MGDFFDFSCIYQKKAVPLRPVTDKNCKNMSFMADKLQNYMSFAADR